MNKLTKWLENPLTPLPLKLTLFIILATILLFNCNYSLVVYKDVISSFLGNIPSHFWLSFLGIFAIWVFYAYKYVFKNFFLKNNIGKEKDKKSTNPQKAILAFSLVIILWFYSGVFIFYLSDIQSISEATDKSTLTNKVTSLLGERGTIGDMFGAVNALFTGLALAAVFYTILLQRQAINIQKEELAQTRDVFIQQKFETTFFNLLELVKSNLNAIEYDSPLGNMLNGTEAITSINVDMRNNNNNHAIPRPNNIQEIIHATGSVLLSNNQAIVKYLNSVESLLHFNKNSLLNKKNLFYTQLFLNQLSEPEKVLIFNYTIFPEKSTFQKLCYESKLLAGIEKTFFDDDEHYALYRELVYVEQV